MQHLSPVRASHDGAVVLPFFADVPKGHATVIQDNQMHWPVLCAGEWALIDTTDRTLVPGQIYAIQQIEGPRLWTIRPSDPKTTASDDPSWWLTPLRRQNFDEAKRIADEEARERPGSLPMLDYFMSDGPMFEWALRERVIGRVVGIYDAARASVVA